MSLLHLPLDKWLDNVAMAALSSRETVQASYDIARLAIDNGVPGDFVECGVYGGAQCAAMARALMDALEPCNVRDDLDAGFISNREHSFKRRVHLFDSFAGVPAAGPHDAGWTHAPNTAAVCSLDACKAHMREWGIPDELLVWHPGPFEETVTVCGNDLPAYPLEIAILRLDADLYESTRLCMEHLYPLVSAGGWVIVDDFALDGARKAVMEVVHPSPVYFQVHR